MLEAPCQCSPFIIMKRHTVTEEMKKLLSVWLQKNIEELPHSGTDQGYDAAAVTKGE